MQLGEMQLRQEVTDGWIIAMALKDLRDRCATGKLCWQVTEEELWDLWVACEGAGFTQTAVPVVGAVLAVRWQPPADLSELGARLGMMDGEIEELPELPPGAVPTVAHVRGLKVQAWLAIAAVTLNLERGVGLAWRKHLTLEDIERGLEAAAEAGWKVSEVVTGREDAYALKEEVFQRGGWAASYSFGELAKTPRRHLMGIPWRVDATLARGVARLYGEHYGSSRNVVELCLGKNGATPRWGVMLGPVDRPVGTFMSEHPGVWGEED